MTPENYLCLKVNTQWDFRLYAGSILYKKNALSFILK